MKSTGPKIPARPHVRLLLVAVVFWSSIASAERPGWKEEKVNWRLPGGLAVRSISYPEDKPPATLEKRSSRRPARHRRKLIKTAPAAATSAAERTSTAVTVYADVIDSPPIDGFVPYVAIGITDERSYEWYYTDANTEYSVCGSYLSANPETDYAVGIYDTGASAHIMNVYDAVTTGIYDAGLVTSFPVTLKGATGNIDAFASQPIAVFTDGLEAIDANTLLLDDSNMVGQSNVSVIVGDIVQSPNLPTVVGSPLAFFVTSVIENSRPVTRVFDGNEITAPRVTLHRYTDPAIPSYSRKINLELRPATGYAVQYMPCMEALGETCPEGDGEPTTPSIVFGSSFDISQSLFFTNRTDLANGGRTSQQKKFMFDTGAEITVISESQAAELELLAAEPNFYVEVMGVTGDVNIAPGYYVDEIEISATPAWLSYTNVPVIVLNIDSPEGGVLEGIIGMNLFVDMDFYLHGGGLYGQDPPYIKFEFLPARPVGDIAPAGGDGCVDILDLAELARAWPANPLLANWNSQADLIGDAVINFADFAVLAQHWLEQAGP